MTFGVQHVARSGAGHEIALKTAPSGGARHPIEAYLAINGVEEVESGLYHYDCWNHCLVQLSSGMSSHQLHDYVPSQPWFCEAQVVVFMAAVYDRTSFRYPAPRAYRNIFLESGHLAQSFCSLATELDLAPFCSHAIADSSIDSALKLDGVTEGVVYLIGCGTQPSEGWRPGVPGLPNGGSMNITWSLVASGNTKRFALDDDAIRSIRARLAMHQPVTEIAAAKDECVTCTNTGRRFVALLGDSPEDILRIDGANVRLGSMRVIDPDQTFVRFYQQLFTRLTTVVEPSELRNTFTPGRHGESGQLDTLPCDCGKPADFDDWSGSNTRIINSCYNYAVKDCWTTGPWGGATPNANSMDIQDWKVELTAAGLTWAGANWATVPAPPASEAATGWYVALALQERTSSVEFHFLRLDGTQWSHKWSSAVPQLCDLNENLIPRNAVHSAKLCGYELVGFFWVPRPLKVK